jgi:glutathione S-transferase
MSRLTLVIGSKNLSSWSLRPWLVLEHLGIPFEEVLVPLDRPETGDLIREHSAAGKVPVLRDGDLVVWDSLAIVEYVAELHPDAGVWPQDRAERAEARAVAAEMHSGFSPLRRMMPMAFKDFLASPEVTPRLEANIDRVTTIWTSLRQRFKARGPFLFGTFSAADAFYAPVVSRFRTYRVPVSGEAATYASTIWGLPAMRRWLEGARAES